MSETLPVITDVTVGAEGFDGAGEVALDKVSGAIDKLKRALTPTMAQPASGGLALESIEVGLAVTVGSEVGIFAKGTAEAEASITVTFARPEASP